MRFTRSGGVDAVLNARGVPLPGDRYRHPKGIGLARMKTMRTSYAAIWIRSLSKADLEYLIDDVKRGEGDAISRSIAFVTAESFGYWHNRARAKLCRHFKNHPPSRDECDRLVDAIIDRLLGGYFYEQFFDQLSMAIRFSPGRLSLAASIASQSDRQYIRRYGARVQHAIKSIPPSTDVG